MIMAAPFALSDQSRRPDGQARAEEEGAAEVVRQSRQATQLLSNRPAP
jgi:hypothetical protein